MIFRDRLHAAELLSARLSAYRGRHPLVLAIPRGAVPMADVIARSLDGDLGVVLVRKIPAPFQPELALGSVGESGHVYHYPEVARLGISDEYLEAAKLKELDLIHRRRKRYGLNKLPLSAKGRLVIIVDDGIATGSSMMGAIHEVKMQQPAQLVVATAAASTQAASRLEPEIDAFVALIVTDEFYAVGQFFEDFSQVSDEEVIRILDRRAR